MILPKGSFATNTDTSVFHRCNHLLILTTTC